MSKSFLSLFHTPPADQGDAVHLRGWFIFYVLWMIVLTAAAMISMHFWSAYSNPVWQKIWLGALYLFYMSLCCTFFPAPTAWIVLLMASPMVGLVGPSIFESFNLSPRAVSFLSASLTILLVAAVGAVGTAIANLNEYHIFTFGLRFGKIHKIRQTRLYQWAEKWFSVSPFALLTAVSFIPIPIDVVRWLAITARYPRLRYALAYFTGRSVRYALLATAATCLHISWSGILVIQAALVAIILLRFIPQGIRRLKSHKTKNNNTEGLTV